MGITFLGYKRNFCIEKWIIKGSARKIGKKGKTIYQAS